MSAVAPLSRVDAGTLRSFTANALSACGLPPRSAMTVAETMVEADLSGADTHGTFRLPQYAAALKAGDMNPAAEPQLFQSTPAIAIVDGAGGMGHLAMDRAVTAAAAMAARQGIGWVGVRASNHAGALGVYAARLAKLDQIGICAAVSSINHMAPSGSAEALLGTNPIAIAIPAGDAAPIVIDIATSVAAFGKIMAAARDNRAIPVGWAISRETGEPVTDPNGILEALLLPLGDYKGAALALAIGVLAGVLNGADFGRDIPDFAAPARPVNTGQMVIAVNVQAFRPLHGFVRDMDRHIADFTGSKRLPGRASVRLPGGERAERHHDRSTNGIPLSDARLADLDQLAETLGIPPLVLPPSDKQTSGAAHV